MQSLVLWLVCAEAVAGAMHPILKECSWCWGGAGGMAALGITAGEEIKRRKPERARQLCSDGAVPSPRLGQVGGDPDPGTESQPGVAVCQEVTGAGWGDAGIAAFPGKQLKLK